MALILVRANNQKKLLNTIADIERHAKLKIIGKPKRIDPKIADKAAERILKQKLRMECRIAALIKVKENATRSIMCIKKIHPRAHITVVSREYKEFEVLDGLFRKLPVLRGYYSPK